MKGKTAIVTGSTSGIGLGIAQALAAQGADIMLNGFGDVAEIAKLQKQIAARHTVKVSYSAADLSKPNAVSNMVEQATSELGRVDILIWPRNK
jgi:3-hydroxybutyrate dehydrogenase